MSGFTRRDWLIAAAQGIGLLLGVYAFIVVLAMVAAIGDLL